MNTIELQNTIIRKILTIKDNQLLDYLNGVLSIDKENSTNYKLNDFEKQVINESLTDYKNGEIISNDDVFFKTEKWLEE